MDRNDYLERVSDKIRRGEPVGFADAIAAIDYQESVRRHLAKNTLWRRVVRQFRNLIGVSP